MYTAVLLSDNRIKKYFLEREQTCTNLQKKQLKEAFKTSFLVTIHSHTHTYICISFFLSVSFFALSFFLSLSLSLSHNVLTFFKEMPHAFMFSKIQVTESLSCFIKYTENLTKYTEKVRKNISFVDAF